MGGGGLSLCWEILSLWQLEQLVMMTEVLAVGMFAFASINVYQSR